MQVLSSFCGFFKVVFMLYGMRQVSTPLKGVQMKYPMYLLICMHRPVCLSRWYRYNRPFPPKDREMVSF